MSDERHTADEVGQPRAMTAGTKSRKRLTRIGGGLLARYISFVKRTSVATYEPSDALERLRNAHPCIIAFWHGQFMLIPVFCPRGMDVRVMVARHGDAELIGEIVARHGFELIRGAGAGSRRRDRGGAAALRTALDSLDAGWSIAMTAEVPPGPARRVGPGIVTLARLSGRPIVPVAIASSRFRSFDTWSRMTFNLSHSRIGVAVGEPIYVEADADEAAREVARVSVEQALDRATRQAYGSAGADLARSLPASNDPAAPPSPVGFGLHAYRSATRLLSPLAPVLIAARARQGKEDWERRRERFGFASAPRPSGALIWVHAASVGETNAVLPLLARLRSARPDLGLLLTTGTRTSAAIAADRLPDGAIHQYVPLDTPQVVARFLDHWRPDAIVLTESEIWPNTILDASARGIPIAVINARMSARSFQRWRRNRKTSRALFNRLRLVLAQSEPLLRRFRELGARDVRDTGNIKVDAPPLPVDHVHLEQLRAAIGNRPVLLAASTHDGEERLVLEAVRSLIKTHPDLLTIIAPRHPERGGTLAGEIAAAGLSVARRSEGSLPQPSTRVYLADTIGELGLFYSVAPIAFVGGSLIDRGGQNPIEAIRFGAVVLTGPSTRNFPDAYGELLRREGAVLVRDAADFAKTVASLIGNLDELARRRRAASQALDRLSGALERSTEALLSILVASKEVDGAV